MSTYSVTLDSYTPSPRSDAAGVWTHVRWDQLGATRAGTPSSLETQTLDVGTDPAAPETVTDLTTELATVYPGWFRVVALDAQGVQEPTEPFFAGSALRPSVAEVAGLMPDRTTVDGGTEARTFNTATSPTAAEVEALIDMVLDSVEPRVPPGAAAKVERAGRHVVTLNTAILVESGNWGDQIETNAARVALWERLITAHEATLDAAANEDLAGSARFGSIKVTSPTLTAWGAMTGVSTELIP